MTNNKGGCQHTDGGLMMSFSYYVMTDELLVQVPGSTVAHATEVDDGLLVGLDAGWTFVELYGEQATFGRTHAWRQAVRDLVGDKAVELLDYCDDIGDSARNVTLWISCCDMPRVRRAWSEVIARSWLL